MNILSTPPRRTIGTSSIIERVKECFRLWCEISPHMIKTVRYTTGSRIENHFLDLLELIYKAYYTKTNDKNEILTQCIQKNDLIIFLLQITWENKFIKQSHYYLLSDKTNEVGKMLNGWKQNIQSKVQNKNTL